MVLHDLVEEREQSGGVGRGGLSVRDHRREGSRWIAEMLYLNGEFMPLSEGRVDVEDRGFQLGDGVYEVIKVMNGRLVWLDDHLERLGRSLAAVRLAEALEGHRLDSVLPELVDRSGVRDGMVYVQVTRGVAPREFVFPHPPHPTVLAYARSKPSPRRRRDPGGNGPSPGGGPALGPLRHQVHQPAGRGAGQGGGSGGRSARGALPGPGRGGARRRVVQRLRGARRRAPHPSAEQSHPRGITRKHVLEIARRTGYTVEERAFTLAEVTRRRKRRVRGLHRLDHEGHPAGRADRRIT